MDQKYGIYAVCKTGMSREIRNHLHDLEALSVLYFRNTELKYSKKTLSLITKKGK